MIDLSIARLYLPATLLCASVAFAGSAHAQGRGAAGQQTGQQAAAAGQQAAAAGQQIGQQAAAAGQQAAASGRQIAQAARAFAGSVQTNRRAAAQCAQDLVDAAQQVLALDDAGLDQLEVDLEAAYDQAKTDFEALPDADQTEANLVSLITTEVNAVFATYTQDTAQLAALDTAAQAFAACVAPLEIQFAQEREAFRQRIQSLTP